MVRILFGVFVLLHGLVHLLYLGQSARYFELQPGLAWPDGSWAIYLLAWDGRVQRLPDKGAIGIAINAAIVAAVLAVRWPV
jgi:hypothetical protein